MMHNPPIIGMIGRARSGKNTFADYLVERHGYVAIAYADPLREAALALDPLVGPTALPGHCVADYHGLREVVEALGWEAAKDFVPGVRTTLQRLGTDSIRALDPEFWTRVAAKRIEEISRGDNPRPVVVTDVRLPNEADLIHEAGGALVRITRGTPSPSEHLHISETALDSFHEDYLVPNYGSLDLLAAKADQIAGKLDLLANL